MVALILLIATAALASVCPSYQCGSLSDDLCVSYDGTTNTYSLQDCKASNTYCNATPNSMTNVTCSTYNPAEAYINYAGEYCKDSTHCYMYYPCNNNVCTAKSYNATCGISEECGVGMYCAYLTNSTGTYPVCQYQKKVGERCVNDEDCVNTAACAYDYVGNGTCTTYFSLPNGYDVAQCPGHINKLCKSSVCVLNGRTNYTCIDAPATLASLPSQCNPSSQGNACNSQYLYNYGESYFIQLCECGYNNNGTAYCNMNPGDPMYQKFFEYERLWYNTTYVSRCNTQVRESLACIETYWDKYDKYAYYYYAVVSYPQLQDNADCVKKIYNSAFYYGNGNDADSDDNDDSDGGVALALGGVVAVLSL